MRLAKDGIHDDSNMSLECDDSDTPKRRSRAPRMKAAAGSQSAAKRTRPADPPAASASIKLSKAASQSAAKRTRPADAPVASASKKASASASQPAAKLTAAAGAPAPTKRKAAGQARKPPVSRSVVGTSSDSENAMPAAHHRPRQTTVVRKAPVTDGTNDSDVDQDVQDIEEPTLNVGADPDDEIDDQDVHTPATGESVEAQDHEEIDAPSSEVAPHAPKQKLTGGKASLVDYPDTDEEEDDDDDDDDGSRMPPPPTPFTRPLPKRVTSYTEAPLYRPRPPPAQPRVPHLKDPAEIAKGKKVKGMDPSSSDIGGGARLTDPRRKSKKGKEKAKELSTSDPGSGNEMITEGVATKRAMDNSRGKRACF